MRLFGTLNSLVVTRNQWLHWLSKIWQFSNLVKHVNFFLKFYWFQICAHFFSSFSGCWVTSHFVIFHYIKVAKHSWDNAARNWQLISPHCFLMSYNKKHFHLNNNWMYTIIYQACLYIAFAFCLQLSSSIIDQFMHRLKIASCRYLHRKFSILITVSIEKKY